MRNFIFSLFFMLASFSWSQVLVINELDANDPSTDDEEFIEIKSQMPNFALDGYVLVFFNGNNTSQGNNLSYLTFDLAGFKTDGNGLFVMGNKLVLPFPQEVLTNGLFQNGADGVAIYQTSVDNFPDRTPATTNFNLIDALVYDTGSISAVDNDLLTALGETTQYFEGSGVANERKSLQLKPDGTYEAENPTPRMLNDLSGAIVNPVTIGLNALTYTEGESFTITFTTAVNVDANTNFDITLSNDGFTSADFTGNLNLTIPANQNSVTTTITLTDDTDFDEGDEEILIEINNLEEEFQPTSISPVVAGSNLIIVRIVDNDFNVAPWGTPLVPTYDQVTSTQPAGYYDSLIGKSGDDLRQAIQDIIADENTVRTHSYADVYDILAIADQNPLNSNEVWMLYTEQPRSKLDRQTSGSSSGKWNREHTFPRSRGNFDEWEDFDDFATGINSFISTSADSLRHGYSDAHALRVADGGENSRRSNKHYSNNFVSTSNIGQYNGPSNVDPANGIGVSFRGDVARSVLYMELRYNGLQIVDGFPTASGSTFDGQLGDLTTILGWHDDDAPDDFEMNRNNVVYDWQRNRNPLIDLPDLVDYIWGSRQGEVWMGALSTTQNELSQFTFYPNPAKNNITFSGLQNYAIIEVFSIEGRKVETLRLINNTAELNLTSGVYLLKVKQNDTTVTRRLIIK